jgi:hypothetical protein
MKKLLPYFFALLAVEFSHCSSRDKMKDGENRRKIKEAMHAKLNKNALTAVLQNYDSTQAATGTSAYNLIGNKTRDSLIDIFEGARISPDTASYVHFISDLTIWAANGTIQNGTTCLGMYQLEGTASPGDTTEHLTFSFYADNTQIILSETVNRNSLGENKKFTSSRMLTKGNLVPSCILDQ